MIFFTSYSLVFATLLWWATQRFPAAFKGLNRKLVVLLFLIKITAVPVFSFIYERWYGGIDNLDAGKFYHDVKVISAGDRSFFWRLMLGQQEDIPGSQDYEQYLKHTKNWDNGTVKDFLYNDNRVLIRVHALLDVFTFNSYLVHALFSCIFSCIGIWWLFQAFRHLFEEKEIHFLMVLCLFPALWFYTGALLKEGLCLLSMGALARGLSLLFTQHWRGLFWLLPAMVISLFLKPYLLLSFFTFCCLYFLMPTRFRFRLQVVIFATLLLSAFVLGNFASQHFKNRSLTEAALQHQKRFEAVSRGGVFLSDGYHYLQLPADTHLILKQSAAPLKYHIRPGTRYMYWKPARSFDTLYNTAAASDTSTYDLLYYLPTAGSNIQLNKSSGGRLAFSAWFHALLQPFFWPVRGVLSLLASFENLLLIICGIIILLNSRKKGTGRLFALVFISFALALCLLIGVTAPNSGAIFRYRAPAVVFIPLSALLFLPKRKKKGLNFEGEKAGLSAQKDAEGR